MAISTSRRHLPSTSPSGTTPRAWGAALVVLLLGLLVAGAVTAVLHVDPRRAAAVRDVMAIATSGDDLPYYAAWGTYTGVLAWCAAAAVLALGARLVVGTSRRRAALLAGAGVVSLVLAVDDLYMLHDAFLLQRGVDERLTQGLVAGLAVAWALAFARDLLAAPETPVLAVAVVFLVHSTLSDVVGDVVLHEEATKLASALCWAVWAYRVAVREVVADRPA